MIRRDYQILSPDGIHARPATALIRLVRTFKSTVQIGKGEQMVRLTSMLNILTLSAKGGDTLTAVIEGEDEQQAAEILDHFFQHQLKEL